MNYYAILGISYGASPDEIKHAFLGLAKIHHPDKGGDVRKFQEINNAYQELKNNPHAGSHETYRPVQSPGNVRYAPFATQDYNDVIFDIFRRMAQDEQVARNKRAQADAMQRQSSASDIERNRQRMADILRDAENIHNRRRGGASPWR